MYLKHLNDCFLTHRYTSKGELCKIKCCILKLIFNVYFNVLINIGLKHVLDYNFNCSVVGYYI